MSEKPNEPTLDEERPVRNAYLRAAMACAGVSAYDSDGSARRPLAVRDACCEAINALRKQYEKEERRVQRTDA